jgi:NADPH:quinone reductase-like Zn-dependent oxidoreductase
MILGYDLAGVVEKAGDQVKNFKAGDAVYAYLSVPRGGGYAQYAIAKPEEMSRKPKNIDFEKAAAVPLAATTAWQALVDTAKIESGQTVLIHGGSGGVGSFAVQIAKARGAKVIATASTANQDLLKQLGVDRPIDYTKTKFEDVVKDVGCYPERGSWRHARAFLRSSEKGRHHRFNHGRAGCGRMCQT